MKNFKSSLAGFCIFAILTAVLTGCCWVDEDLSECETTYNIGYELRLVTNMTTELQTQLGMAADVQVASALETYLKDVFTDYAHDVDLSFYDVLGDSLRLHHESHIMDASQSSYSLFIPVRKYMHVALANNSQVPQLQLLSDDKCHTAILQQVVKDTVDTYKRAVFTARLPMDIQEGEDQQFDVKLYTTSCAHALVLDTLGSHITDMKVFASGFATGFSLADSTYLFSYTPMVRADKVETEGTPGKPLCYAAVTFPSRSVSDTKVIIPDDDWVSDVADESLWYYTVYTTLPDGSVTKTVLGVKIPICPGQLKIIKCTVTEDGAVNPEAPWVGMSVTLKWNERPGWEVVI